MDGYVVRSCIGTYKMKGHQYWARHLCWAQVFKRRGNACNAYLSVTGPGATVCQVRLKGDVAVALVRQVWPELSALKQLSDIGAHVEAP